MSAPTPAAPPTGCEPPSDLALERLEHALRRAQRRNEKLREKVQQEQDASGDSVEASEGTRGWSLQTEAGSQATMPPSPMRLSS